MASDVPPEFVEFARTADEGSWNAAIAEHRAPDAKEQVRNVLSKYVPDDRLDAVMAVVDPAKLAGADGRPDEAKVKRDVVGAFFSGGSEGHNCGPKQWDATWPSARGPGAPGPSSPSRHTGAGQSRA